MKPVLSVRVSPVPASIAEVGDDIRAGILVEGAFELGLLPAAALQVQEGTDLAQTADFEHAGSGRGRASRSWLMTMVSSLYAQLAGVVHSAHCRRRPSAAPASPWVLVCVMWMVTLPRLRQGSEWGTARAPSPVPAGCSAGHQCGRTGCACGTVGPGLRGKRPAVCLSFPSYSECAMSHGWWCVVFLTVFLIKSMERHA